jgi:hypothetical protein
MTFTNEEIARIAHGAAVELAVVLGEPALPPWASLDPKIVAQTTTLVRVARFGASPEAVHEQRMQLDPELMPFDQLPPGDRAKDYLFAGVCAAMNQAADVKARAENEQRAIADSLVAVAAFAAENEPLGSPLVTVDLQPTPPAQAPREE